MNDGGVSLRRFQLADRAEIVGSRDDESRRFLGEGTAEPAPTCVVLDRDGEVVGWVDFDFERDWLMPDQANVGYCTFPEHRGRGYATAALRLFVEFLGAEAVCDSATLLIDPANAPSIAVARGAGFELVGDVRGQHLFARSTGRNHRGPASC